MLSCIGNSFKVPWHPFSGLWKRATVGEKEEKEEEEENKVLYSAAGREETEGGNLRQKLAPKTWHY